MFTTIRNGQIAQRPYVKSKLKKNCEPFLKILWDEGFILGYTICIKTQTIIISLKYYNDSRPAINSIKLVTTPNNRIYYSAKQIWKIDSNSSFLIISTPKGLKSITECKKLNIGGEPFITLN